MSLGLMRELLRRDQKSANAEPGTENARQIDTESANAEPLDVVAALAATNVVQSFIPPEIDAPTRYRQGATACQSIPFATRLCLL